MPDNRYAVVGNPISHSLSPKVHRLFAESTGQNIQYDKVLVEPPGFESWVNAFFQSGGSGLNVTLPFKVRAFKLAKHASKRAHQAQAANTLGINQVGELWADNTDGIGLTRDIKNHGHTLKDKSIVILGAGGAVRGVLGSLLEQEPSSIIIVNRTLANAAAIVQSHDDNRVSARTFADSQRLTAPDWLISGLSSGLDGQLPPIPSSLVGTNTHVYDMIYGASDTALIQWAKQHGVTTTLDGLGMLIEQAAESFRLWRGVQPNAHSTIRSVRDSLA